LGAAGEKGRLFPNLWVINTTNIRHPIGAGFESRDNPNQVAHLSSVKTKRTKVFIVAAMQGVKSKFRLGKVGDTVAQFLSSV
jgi:hypothetical protein